MKKGPPSPPPGTAGVPAPESAENAVASKVGAEILKARNAAGKQAKAAPRSEYQRPHQVHSSLERRIANARHHRAEMEDEARKSMVGVYESIIGITAPEEEESRRVEGLNFDDERKKRGRQQPDDENDDDRNDDAEEAVALGQAAAAKGFASADGAGKYFQDAPEDRLGDPTLTSPNEMKRLLGPTVRFAKHAMLLAEEKLKTGESRNSVIEFLASLYVGVEDRAYANKALREFGCGTGIIDVYPLEVMEHLLENVPAFFTRVSKGSFFTSSSSAGYKGVTGEPIVLTYDPELRIRGFALKDGAKPGYLFEPVDPPGTYHLTFRTPGTFTVIVSAISKNGSVAIEELVAEIALGDAAAFDKAAALERERAHEADESAESSDAPPAPEREPKKDDLKISFPRRI